LIRSVTNNLKTVETFIARTAPHNRLSLKIQKTPNKTIAIPAIITKVFKVRPVEPLNISAALALFPPPRAHIAQTTANVPTMVINDFFP
jgi:hypothetical protein